MLKDYEDLSSINQQNETLEFEKESLPFFVLVFAYFFQPGRFARSYGIHASIGFLWVALWVTGFSQIVARFEKSITLGTTRSWFPESWIEILSVALTAGIIRGWVLYGIGGLWYRIRLMMCGIQLDDEPWRKTGLVYITPGIAKHSLVVLFFFISMTQHDSYIDSIQNESIVWGLGMVTILFIAEIWSSIALYIATIAVFPAKKWVALIWFLVLPILLRLVGYGILIGVAFMNFAAAPSLDQPSKHINESFEFGFPSNWYVTRDEETPGPVMWVQIEPLFGDAFIEFELVYYDPEIDLVETRLKNLQENAGLQIVSDPKLIETQGPFDGFGFDYIVKIDGVMADLIIFEVEVDANMHLIITALSESSSWETLKPGYDHILKTLKIAPSNTIVPSISDPYRVINETLDLDMPSNWWLTHNNVDDQIDEDGNVSKGFENIKIQPPGWGSFDLYLFESELAIEEELESTVQSLVGTYNLDDVVPESTWSGIEGVGIRGTLHYLDETTGSALVWLTSLEDGRMVEVKILLPDEYQDVQIPGFELIESSFEFKRELKALEP